MTTIRTTRLNDRLDADRQSGISDSLSNLLGTWTNTFETTGEIARIDLHQDGEGLIVNAYGATDGEPVDWGSVPGTPFMSNINSNEVTGFEAHYDFGHTETWLAANFKLGVLVIQSYNRFKDDSGRANYFKREFFHGGGQPCVDDNSQAASTSGSTASAASDSLEDVGAQADITQLLGRWVNTNQNTEWITRFELAEQGGSYTMRASGCPPHREWGVARITTYDDNIGEMAFSVTYHLDDVQPLLAANTNKGLIVIALFLRLKKGSEKANFLCREFFRREA